MFFLIVRDQNPRRFSIVYGTIDLNNNENVIDVADIVYHEDFNNFDLFNDVSVLTVSLYAFRFFLLQLDFTITLIN